MLIIFDLDDTLIPTSEHITPWRFLKLKEFLSLHNVEECSLTALYQDLLEKHQQFNSSAEAVEFFFRKHNILADLLEPCLLELTSYDENMPACVFKGVYSLLNTLKKSFTIAIVTSGKKEIQELKIAKAALDSLYF